MSDRMAGCPVLRFLFVKYLANTMQKKAFYCYQEETENNLPPFYVYEIYANTALGLLFSLLSPPLPTTFDFVFAFDSLQDSRRTGSTPETQAS